MLAVDKTTGEVSHAIVCAVPEGSKIYTPAQQRAYEKLKEAQRKKYFARLSNSELGHYYFVSSAEKFKGLTPETVTRLIYLSTHLIRYNTNTLMLTRKTPMRRKDLAKVLGVSKSTANRFWCEVSPKYIDENENGLLITNTEVFKRGSIRRVTDDNPYLKMYINGVRKLYESAETSNYKRLGYLFKLLPFVNLEYNILCANPLEADIENIEPLTIAQFCELIGYDKSHINRLLEVYNTVRFEVNGRQERFCSVVYNGIDRNNAMIIINPHILYSGSDYNAVKVLGAFHC